MSTETKTEKQLEAIEKVILSTHDLEWEDCSEEFKTKIRKAAARAFLIVVRDQ